LLEALSILNFVGATCEADAKEEETKGLENIHDIDAGVRSARK
jgi:hypothetical protein